MKQSNTNFKFNLARNNYKNKNYEYVIGQTQLKNHNQYQEEPKAENLDSKLMSKLKSFYIIDEQINNLNSEKNAKVGVGNAESKEEPFKIINNKKIRENNKSPSKYGVFNYSNLINRPKSKSKDFYTTKSQNTQKVYLNTKTSKNNQSSNLGKQFNNTPTDGIGGGTAGTGIKNPYENNLYNNYNQYDENLKYSNLYYYRNLKEDKNKNKKTMRSSSAMEIEDKTSPEEAINLLEIAQGLQQTKANYNSNINNSYLSNSNQINQNMMIPQNVSKKETYVDLKRKIMKINQTGFSKSRSKSKDNIKVIPSNDKYVSLYEDFRRIKAKQEGKTDEKEFQIKRNMTPSITEKAKKIIRNPNNFQDRLYPSKKIQQQQVIDKKIKDYPSSLEQHFKDKQNIIQVLDSEEEIDELYGDESPQSDYFENQIYHKTSKHKKYNEDLSFTPMLDKKSLRIANRLEPAFSRLVSKRSRSKTSCNSKNHSFINVNTNNINIQYNFHNKSFNHKKEKSGNTSLNNSRLNSKSPSLMHSPGKQLYEKGLNSLKKKILNYEIKCQQLDDLYKEFSYKPNILPSSKVYQERLNKHKQTANKEEDEEKENNISNSKSFKQDSMYDRHQNWKSIITEKLDKSREKKLKLEKDECTFSPCISSRRISNDEKIIKNNLSSMHDYIQRRRDSIAKEKEKQELYNKKFNNGRYYEIKQTKPINKTLEIDKRMNQRNTKIRNKTPENIHSYREKTNTASYFLNPPDSNRGMMENRNYNYNQSQNSNQNKKFRGYHNS